MDRLVLHLPTPPSVNSLYRNVPRVGRVKTTPYKNWCDAADLVLAYQLRGKDLPIEGPVSCHYTVRNHRSRDLGNYEKALGDILVSAGIIEGDSWEYIKEIHLEWGDVEGVLACIRRVEQT